MLDATADSYTLAWTHGDSLDSHAVLYRINSLSKKQDRRPHSPPGSQMTYAGIQLNPTNLLRRIEELASLNTAPEDSYHPLQIGDELDNARYRVIDKLGYGGYSTIWLARDFRKARYVAVKVITADASLITSLGNTLSRSGKGFIPPLIDEFWIAGPNGKHKCIVTPPALMSLFDAKEASTFGLFRPKVAQSIVAQLIHGVAFLYSEHIVYDGNILVQFPKAIDHLSTSELYEKFRKPEPEAIVRLDGKPFTNGVPTQFGVRSEDIDFSERIILSDFGESFNPHISPKFSSKTLPLLQPPEARFSDEPLSFASDIWSLACTIWEIAGYRPLFEAFFPTADRSEVLGILPPEWWEKWSRRLDWFNEEGELNLKPGISARRALGQRFEYSIQEPRAETGLETMTGEERRAIKVMLRSMLVYRPDKRATAQQVLHSEWMKDWGQPALEQSRSTSMNIDPSYKPDT
ncbi:CMGC/SRPK protein kinase [Penicillium samsonianum]|uniref:CMGC/SRPK protein kinase n=1 Tax=Penicillium samsonianum TaxID=1882272 RepID=UPI002547C0D3|nr:CMGC/SRPK protein kinase [Penicillium samsonianum]KAJ6125259.1 CMGC/SRPK protein kinase [Penicillium samsonianum]